MIRNVLLLFMLGTLMVPTDVVAVAETTNMRCVAGDTNRTVEGVVVDEERKDKSCGIDSEEEIFVVVEEMPEFPEGSLLEYLARRIKYPVKSLENREEGVVYVSFVVDCSGKVVNARIAKGASALLDKEALRIVNEMPVWKPGKQRGKAVKVQYILPIEFKLKPQGK